MIYLDFFRHFSFLLGRRLSDSFIDFKAMVVKASFFSFMGYLLDGRKFYKI